jgi:hypothetical protein
MMARNPGMQQKALRLNLDPSTYGTFAEIGAGQEVARWFFHVGSATGTVAKSISAYDMALSDSLYGPAERYVSRQRLASMLDHELGQLLSSLAATRGDTTTFFAFADTVATHGQSHPGTGRGWVGLRFQAHPREQPSEIIVHLHLFDTTTVAQQEALGIFGVNLIYGVFYLRKAEALIGSLFDDLSRARVEADMIRFSGPAYEGIDNRLVSLQLVEQALTDAAMFTATGEVVQPSEVLHQKPILVERGSFRPMTMLTLDLLERARERFRTEPAVSGEEPVVLAEMALRDLLSGGAIDHTDFLARADILGTLGFDVLISRFEPYYQLAEYLVAYTDRMVGIAVGLPSIREIVEEKYYRDLPGGVLESIGRLFKRSVKLYVYPVLDATTGRVHDLREASLHAPWTHLRALLLELGQLEHLRPSDVAHLSIRTGDVRALIQAGDLKWESMVPPRIAAVIKTRRLFGWRPSPETTTD